MLFLKVTTVQAMVTESSATIHWNTFSVSIGGQIILPENYSDNLFGDSFSSVSTNFAPPTGSFSSGSDSSFRSVFVPPGTSGGSINLVGTGGNTSSVLTSPEVITASTSPHTSPNTGFSSNFADATRFLEVIAPISGILEVSFLATTYASLSDIFSDSAFAEATLSIASNGGFQELTRGGELGFGFFGGGPIGIFGFPGGPFATAANDSIAPPTSGLGEAMHDETFTLTLSQNVIAGDIIHVTAEALASVSSAAVVPLPTSLVLFSSALLGLAGISRRKTI